MNLSRYTKKKLKETKPRKCSSKFQNWILNSSLYECKNVSNFNFTFSIKVRSPSANEDVENREGWRSNNFSHVSASVRDRATKIIFNCLESTRQIQFSTDLLFCFFFYHNNRHLIILNEAIFIVETAHDYNMTFLIHLSFFSRETWKSLFNI